MNSETKALVLRNCDWWRREMTELAEVLNHAEDQDAHEVAYELAEAAERIRELRGRIDRMTAGGPA